MDYRNENINERTKMKLCSIEEQFINMRASGQTVRQIARKMKKSNKTICDLNKKYFREVSDLRNEKLSVLQKKIFEQKQSRLDFLTEQLLIVKETISKKEVFMTYDELVTLAIKISGALNKCESDMLISDLISETDLDENTHKSETRSGERETKFDSETNVSGGKNDNPDENKEVTDNTANSGNAETKNIKKSNTQNDKLAQKSKKQKDKKEKDINNQDKTPESVSENTSQNTPPRTRADFYRRVLKNKQRTPS
jgi:hypothetical protein